MKYYKVGGAIRDRLLNLPHEDSDWVVVGATPQEMLDKGFKPVGKAFPVFLHPGTNEEYALARTETKTGPGYKGFTFHTSAEVTLEEDLKRRDLTVNAIAEDENGRLIDPYDGLRDLDAKILRHVSPAFAEDPVRILRLARFAARFLPLGFRIATETLALMQSMVKHGEVDALVPERVWNELVRALGEQQPSLFFETLRHCGALARLFPELNNLFGVPQRAEHHPEIDTGVHTMMVVDQAAHITDDKLVRFAALVHDLGKGTTPNDILPRHIGHEERGVELLKALCSRYRTPNDYRDLAILVTQYHGVCHRALELRPGTINELLQHLDAFRRPQRFELFLLSCQADSQGRAGKQHNAYPQAELLRLALNAASAVNPQHLIEKGLQGEQLGNALVAARNQAIAAACKQFSPTTTNVCEKD